MSATFDETACRMFTLPGAEITVSLVAAELTHSMGHHGLPVILFDGNRRGMASFGSIVFWLYHNAWEQEFLSITALPFVRRIGELAFSLRVSAEDGDGSVGRLELLDKGCQFEWCLPEDELPALASSFFHIASSDTPLHEHLPNPQPDGKLHGDAEVFLGGTGVW